MVRRRRILARTQPTELVTSPCLSRLKAATAKKQTKGNAREKSLGISWPNGEDGVLWSSFDEDGSMILDSTMQGNEERKIETFTNVVYNIVKERFGTKKVKLVNEQKEQTPNRLE